jgi:hypothetical protein
MSDYRGLYIPMYISEYAPYMRVLQLWFAEFEWAVLCVHMYMYMHVE